MWLEENNSFVPDNSYAEVLGKETLLLFEKEFSRLKKVCFLDHGGATLYSKFQLEKATEELQSNLFSNPHSRNPSSSITTDATDNVRQRILQHFGTDENEYSVIFTSGATASLKLVAESFSFNPNGLFAYLEESHTSVVGMREYVINTPHSSTAKDSSVCSSSSGIESSGQNTYCISKSAFEKIINLHELKDNCKINERNVEQLRNALCAIPAQCNFSGLKYPLEWIPKIQDGSLNRITALEDFYVDDKNVPESSTSWGKSYKWYVMLDAASFVASNKLGLSKYKPDFVALSFYKMFGWPTGLGALLVRNKSGDVLGSKRYFGGGTVNISLPSESFHVKRARLQEKFEDGTISFLSILGVRHGLDALQKFYPRMEILRGRTFRLVQYLYKNLKMMKYRNGQQVARIYADTEYDSEIKQGPVLTFNLLRPNGDIIGYSEMEQIAYLHDVHLRYGCFCNPGACRRHLGLTPQQVLKHYEAGHVCGDMRDIIDGHPTGAIRVSLGYMTTKENIDFLLQLIFKCWVKPFNVSHNRKSQKFPFSKSIKNTNKKEPSNGFLSVKKLSRIFVYPIKSCGPFEVKQTWTLGAHGLLYDREWLIVNSNGVPLTAKREPRLCLIQPTIDISNRKLSLHFPEDHEDVDVPLDVNSHLKKNSFEASICNSKVCGDSVVGIDCGPEISNWLCRVLQKSDLKLIRMSPTNHRKPRNSLDEISLANQSQFLLLSMPSLRQLAQELISSRLLSSLNIPTTVDDEQTFSNLGEENFSPCRTNLNYDDGKKEDTGLRCSMGTKEENKVIENLIGRFRGNFVVEDENDVAFGEELWERVRIGGTDFKSGGPCIRCATICMDPKTGAKSSEPLLTLSRTRGGRPNFGVHLYAMRNNIDHNENVDKSGEENARFLQAIRIGDNCQVLGGNDLNALDILENID